MWTKSSGAQDTIIEVFEALKEMRFDKLVIEPDSRDQDSNVILAEQGEFRILVFEDKEWDDETIITVLIDKKGDPYDEGYSNSFNTNDVYRIVEHIRRESNRMLIDKDYRPRREDIKILENIKAPTVEEANKEIDILLEKLKEEKDLSEKNKIEKRLRYLTSKEYMNKWTKIAKEEDFIGLEEFLSDLKQGFIDIYDEEEAGWDNIEKTFKKIIPSNYLILDSESNSKEFDFASEYFGFTNKDYPSTLPNYKIKEKNGYKAILEGEMTYGIWVSPEFIKKELKK